MWNMDWPESLILIATGFSAMAHGWLLEREEISGNLNRAYCEKS